MSKEDFNNRFAETFIDESLELLEIIESDLIELEKNNQDKEIIDNIFRALHTIKGSGGMFGFEEIEQFAHKIENVFDLIRKDKLEINSEILDLTFKSCDYLKNIINSSEYQKDHIEELNELNVIFETFNIEKDEKNDSQNNEILNKNNIIDKGSNESIKTYRIIFKPDKDIFLRGVDPACIINELNEIGKTHIFGNFENLPDLKNLDPEKCYMKWIIILTTIHDINAIKDVFIFVEEYSTIKIDLINQEDDEYISEYDLEYKKIGEILYERGDITKQDLLKLINEKKYFGNEAIEKGLIAEEELQSALSEQKIVREEKRIRKNIIDSSTIRVKHHKLDELVNLVGELVTLQLRLSQFSENNRNNELQLISERFERLTTDLRDNTMNLRMVPLSKTFNSFYRLVRDLSNELGKEVELTVHGAETELDKNVIESLKDPLIHIIRNSLDHGIELPEIREKSGKPRNALINITAEYSGANVLIKISDNGAGLNLKKIRAKAVEKGIIADDLEINEKDIISLVFAPGFSTAEQTTNISGRGVGMDVVKKNIEKLRGTVEIESKENEGTTVAIKIPLTLAIIDGLLVKVDNNYYVINLSIIEECIDLTKEIKEKINKKNVINLRNELIPFINLREFFEIEGNIPEIEQLVIIRSINNKIGIKVDNVIGQHQTVIKSVSNVFNNIEEVSGATILGNGDVALILDTNKITERIELETENKFKSVKQI